MICDIIILFLFLTVIDVVLFFVQLIIHRGTDILVLQRRVEACLDTIDVVYSRTYAAVSHPIFFDEPFIRRAINEIKMARNELLYTAQVLAGDDESEEDEGERENLWLQKEKQEVQDKKTNIILRKKLKKQLYVGKLRRISIRRIRYISVKYIPLLISLLKT